jgi:hypothetical protein
VRDTWQKLTFKAAAGLLLFVLANLAVYLTSGFFQRERHYRETVEELFERPGVSVVLMGDSHVAEIPDELLAPGAHNLAAGGDGYREIYAKLRYVLARPQKVRTLLLTADYHMFGSGRVQSSNRSFVERYLLATQSGLGYEKSWLSSLFNLVPLFNDDFVQYLKKDLREKFRRARRPSHDAATTWADLPEAMREKRSLETGRGDHAGVGVVKEPVHWFGQILRLAQRHDIEVIPIRYPTSDGYRSQIPPDGKRIVDAAIAQAGAPAVIDVGRALREPAYFADEDHVNRRGAAALLCLLGQRTGLSLSAGDERGECSMFAQENNAGGNVEGALP